MEIIYFRQWDRETNEVKYDMPTELMKRPEEFNNTGKGVQLAINSYPMLSPPTVNVFQYDVSFQFLGPASSLSLLPTSVPCRQMPVSYCSTAVISFVR